MINDLPIKVHELEIQKVEMESEALLKEHELRRRDLLILRYDRQRTLCEEIITRQRQMIEGQFIIYHILYKRSLEPVLC